MMASMQHDDFVKRLRKILLQKYDKDVVVVLLSYFNLRSIEPKFPLCVINTNCIKGKINIVPINENYM